MRLICPVCGGQLNKNGSSYRCENRHCFDEAKEGYVNLLLGSRAGESIGDNRDMALSRRDFLSKGYYRALAQGLADIIGGCSSGGDILDICCGEGYYSAFMAEKLPDHRVTGFDISKEMVRLAAKRRSPASFFVANMTAIPVESGSFDAAVHLFAPFCGREFARVLKDGGTLISAVAGERHLMGLKECLYEKPYLNEEIPPEAERLVLKEKKVITDRIRLTDPRDILSLLKMTPYYYHTPSEGLARLSALEELETELSFCLFIYEKRG